MSRRTKLVFAFLLVPYLLAVALDPRFGLPFVTGWITFLTRTVPKVQVNWSGVGLFVVCLAGVAGLGHGFLSWLWRGMGRPDPWRPRWTAAGLGVVVLMFAAGMAVTGVAHQVGWLISGPPKDLLRNANRALHSLEMILVAQGQFRSNDPARNGKNDYWRADVAGLHALRPGGAPGPIDLIDLSIAMADDRSRSDLTPYAHGVPLPAAKDGYYFRALRFEGEPDDQRSPYAWAVCAFPNSPSAGVVMFIASQEMKMYHSPFAGQPPEFFPSNPEKAGWTLVEW